VPTEKPASEGQRKATFHHALSSIPHSHNRPLFPLISHINTSIFPIPHHHSLTHPLTHTLIFPYPSNRLRRLCTPIVSRSCPHCLSSHSNRLILSLCSCTSPALPARAPPIKPLWLRYRLRRSVSFSTHSALSSHDFLPRGDRQDYRSHRSALQHPLHTSLSLGSVLPPFFCR
jgi:hypothetical protein